MTEAVAVRTGEVELRKASKMQGFQPPYIAAADSIHPAEEE